MNINKDDLVRKFAAYGEAKKKQVLYLKLFFGGSIAIIIAVLFFAYQLATQALDKVIVVNTGGEMLPVETSEMDILYKTLLTTHCYSVSYYVNTFDINNIKGNQARAAFLVNGADLNAIINKYQYDKAYSDAINKGVVYRCKFDKVEQLVSIGNGSEYHVVFGSILSIIDQSGIKEFRILSKGVAIRVTPRYPENPTGWYFKSYVQEYYPIINNENDK